MVTFNAATRNPCAADDHCRANAKNMSCHGGECRVKVGNRRSTSGNRRITVITAEPKVVVARFKSGEQQASL